MIRSETRILQRTLAFGCAFVLAFGATSLSAQQSTTFALHGGDTVVFYGDSITAQRLYTRFVEDFVLTRYPAIQVRFVNAGVPGDTTYGGYAGTMAQRVDHDVTPFHPTMITIMLGMNDGGYGYTPTTAVLANFDKGYADLLNALHNASPNAEFTLINPTPYDETTHGTEFPGYAKIVDKISDEVTKIATQTPAQKQPVLRADFNAPVQQALTRAKAEFPQLASLIIPDRIHPAESGHWIMAIALLAAWHADPTVSRASINMSNMKITASERTLLTKLERTPGGMRWTQCDEVLPLPLDLNNTMTKMLLGVSDIEKWDQQTLRVEALPPGQYQLLIDTKPVAQFSAEELLHGVNLALVKTPMLEQARGVDYEEERRATLDQAGFLLSAEIKQTANTPIARDKLREAQDELAAAIRSKLAPKPHEFELRRQ